MLFYSAFRPLSVWRWDNHVGSTPASSCPPAKSLPRQETSQEEKQRSCGQRVAKITGVRNKKGLLCGSAAGLPTASVPGEAQPASSVSPCPAPSLLCASSPAVSNALLLLPSRGRAAMLAEFAPRKRSKICPPTLCPAALCLFLAHLCRRLLSTEPEG